MDEYKAQFDEWDVFLKLNEFRRLENGNKNFFIITHELNNVLTALVGRDALFQKANSSETTNNHFSIGTPSSEFSKNLGVLFTDFSELYARKGGSDAIDLLIGSRRLTEIIEESEKYFPMSEKFKEVDKLEGESEELIGEIDRFYRMTVYHLNAHFSPDFQRGAYQLKTDFDAEFSIDNKIDGVQIISTGIDNIQTREDYFRLVLLPLIMNAVQHAYDPEFDYSKRLQDSSFKKTITIHSGDLFEIDAIQITVQDNGFGIDPKVKDRVFEKYVTTKKERKNTDGGGLWIAKNVVEDNLGKIWYETRLGHGTSFHFTIPYKAKIAYRFYQ